MKIQILILTVMWFCDTMLDMDITYEDMLLCIKATSKKLSHIFDAVIGTPKSFVELGLSGEIEYEEYYQYNETTGVMADYDGKMNTLHILHADDLEKDLTHYVIRPTPSKVNFVAIAKDNSRLVGKMLEQAEDSERHLFATMHIYTTNKFCNILNDPGKLVGIAEYSIICYSKDKIGLYLRFYPAGRKRKNGEIDFVQHYFPLPQKLVEKFAGQPMSVSDLLKPENEAQLAETVKGMLDDIFKHFGDDEVDGGLKK